MMLPVILQILKIVGVVLLVLLCTILALFLLVLFVPIRYKLEADKNGEHADANASISWLLGFLRAKVRYGMDSGMSVVVKVLFFTVHRSPKPEKSKPKADKAEPGIEKPEVKADTSADKAELETKGKTEKEPKIKVEKEPKTKAEKKPEQKIEDKVSFGERISSFTDKIKLILDTVQNEEDKAAFNRLCKLAGKLLRHIRPRKGSAKIWMGFDDPSLTGQIMAVYSMLYPYIGRRVHVYPDFNTPVLDVDADIRGIVRVVTVGILGIKIYFGKDFKYLKKEIENVREG